MAIPTIVGVGAAASSASTITPAYPAGYTAVADDIAVTFCECDSTDTLTPPSGWALMVGQSVTTGTTTKLSAIWRRVQAGDTAPLIADAGNHLIGRMIIVRGCVASGNPWDIAVGSSELVADTTVSVPTATTTVADCLVLAAFSTGQDIASTAGATAWANANLGSVAEQMDGWTSLGTGGGFSMATGTKATAGAIGATTATLSLTANNKAHLLIALKGASGSTLSVAASATSTSTASAAVTQTGALAATAASTSTASAATSLVSPTPLFGAVGTHQQGSAATISVDVPDGVAAGDIVVVFAFVDNSTVTVTGLASGFAEAADSPVSVTPGGGGQSHTLHVMWKRATGADSTAGTYDFTLSTSTYRYVAAARYSGAAASGDPWDVTNPASDVTNNTPTPAVSDTTTVANTLLIWASTNWSAGTPPSWTPPSGFAERLDTGDGVMTIADKVQTSAGATGSISGSNTGSGARTAWLGALKPAGGSSTLAVNATAASTSTAAATLTLTAAMSATAASTSTASTTLTLRAALSAAAVSTSSASAALTRVTPLAAVAASASSAAVDLTVVAGGTTLALNAVAASTSSAAAAVTLTAAMSAQAVSTSTATATVTQTGVISAAATSASTATAALIRVTPLAAVAVTTSTAAATLTQRIVVSAAAVSTSAATGALTRITPVAAVAASTSTAAADLTVTSGPTVWSVTAAGVSTSSATATLTTLGALTAAAVSTSAATASVVRVTPVGAVAVSASSATATLTLQAVLTATAVSSTSASATLTLQGAFAAAAASLSAAVAALALTGPSAGVTLRPSSGSTARPGAGVITRPSSGTTLRP